MSDVFIDVFEGVFENRCVCSCLLPWLCENTTCPLCKTPINQRRGAGEYASLMPGLAVDL